MTSLFGCLTDTDRLDVSNFSEPKYNVNLVDELVLDASTRQLVKSLSSKYTRSEAPPQPPANSHAIVDTTDQWSADFVQGKGEGLIFLLHGKPGVGKTYTAECVAEFTKRPLLSLTCTDIGTNPSTIEMKLTYWFKLAKHWGVILLIDEADIYMEQRVTRDLNRNNLVAGFLRAMEYYQGILFLTTNRVGTFDEAFISRIHISVYYPDFSDADRNEVWQAFFRKLEREKGEEFVVSDGAREYVKRSSEVRLVKWNGREIRNGITFFPSTYVTYKRSSVNLCLAFQTAVALAETENKRDKENRIVLEQGHIQSIVKMSSAFKKYLNALYQGDETTRAAREGLRVDDFDEKNVDRKGKFSHYV